MVQPYFSDIRSKIIEELQMATSEILVAVCWFTNDSIFQCLCNKLEAGVRVELIVLDDFINGNPFGCDFQRFIDLGGILYLGQVEAPMHNKYCIIDKRAVITGSYNWTYWAETRNDENIVILDGLPEIAQSYEDDFSRLRTTTPRATAFHRKALPSADVCAAESKFVNAFNTVELLSSELFQKAIQTNDPVYYRSAKSIMPENIGIQAKAVQLNWEKPSKLAATMSVEIKDNNVCVIFPVGTNIPAQKRQVFLTTSDKQKTMNCILRLGENLQASKNAKVTGYVLTGFPELPAGQASVAADFRLGVDGRLHIRHVIDGTGVIQIKQFDLNPHRLFQPLN